MTRPRLLDLFCGAGGCSVGYHRAGFDVVGVDNAYQPSYPYPFCEEDAIHAMRALYEGERLHCTDGAEYALEDFAAISASPPCQAYSATHRIGGRRDLPRLIAPTREWLETIGLPFVIENVIEARSELRDPALLCGSMFGLDVRRHRLFETNWPLMVPTCDHDSWRNQYPTHARKDKAQHSPVVHVYGTGGGAGKDLGLWKRVMETPWMQTKAEVCEAIPPAYTELIGHQLAQWISTSTEGRLSPDPANNEGQATCSSPSGPRSTAQRSSSSDSS